MTAWKESEVVDLKVGILKKAMMDVASARGCSVGLEYGGNTAYQGPRRRVDPELEAWIDDHDERQPFGFNACCYAAGLDPDEVRPLFKWSCNKAATS